ncbi:MAG: RNA polymerase sigma factor [Anaerolineae bacterium]|nr:RNA polymerase sigma factor [Anaerolineae bacterium]
MSEALQDAQLVTAACQGDWDAFEALQARLEPGIRRFVRRLSGPSAEDDIVQEVFIGLFLNLARINPPENVRPYVFRMARNRCYDELRSAGRREVLSLDEEPVQVWVSYASATRHSEPPPDELTHWLLLHLDVQTAIDQLPELQQQALILYAEEGLSYAEVAEVMGVSIGTIKSRIHHAKQSLRRLLPPATRAALEQEFSPMRQK